MKPMFFVTVFKVCTLKLKRAPKFQNTFKNEYIIKKIKNFQK